MHGRRKGTHADKGLCDYCHKPFSREHFTLSRHIERHHKDQMENAEVLVPTRKDNFNSQIKKSQLEQYFTSQIPSHTKFEHEECMMICSL